jgi:hypothetical protein
MDGMNLNFFSEKEAPQNCDCHDDYRGALSIDCCEDSLHPIPYKDNPGDTDYKKQLSEADLIVLEWLFYPESAGETAEQRANIQTVLAGYGARHVYYLPNAPWTAEHSKSFMLRNSLKLTSEIYLVNEDIGATMEDYLLSPTNDLVEKTGMSARELREIFDVLASYIKRILKPHAEAVG